jgi:Ca2+-binding RTX toxin-like protein
MADMITIDASALSSFSYSTYLTDFFSALGSTTAGSSTYYGGEYQSPYGYYNGSQVGFRYTDTTNSAQVLIAGSDLAYDGLLGSSYGHGISGTITSITLGSYDSGTTYTQDDTAGTRSELTGVVEGLVISGLDWTAAIGSGTGDSNLVYQVYNALRKANMVVDLDGDGDSGYEYVDYLYSLLGQQAQHLVGSAGADSYTGTDYADQIEGNAGNDALYGGAGADTITGGSGNDVLYGDDGDDAIGGGSYSDTIYGGAGADSISGGTGHDVIDGGEGADTLIGGAGNDKYVVDASGDVVTELTDEGVDTITTTINHYQIADNVEKLILSGSAAIYGYGNDSANTITGSELANAIYGMGGADTIYGGAGNDTLNGGDGDDIVSGGAGNDSVTGGTGADTLTGGSGNDVLSGGDGDDAINGGSYSDTIYGGAGADTISGGTGHDTLDGGAGADTLIGGAGNDKYVVDASGDVVTELSGEGADTITTTLNHYQIASNVETLVLSGSAAFYGYGNGSANTIRGNSLDNAIYGLGGQDTIYGSAGDDVIDGGSSRDALYGGEGDDNIAGGTGNDLLSGSLGADTLAGGSGADTIVGGSGNDVITGGTGNDVITGASGKDVLTGNSGSDTFVFALGSTSTISAKADIISDFSVSADTIDLSGIDANGSVNGDQSFSFIGSSAFSGEAGELRAVVKGGNTLVFADTDGDGKSNFALYLTGSLALQADNFAL